jgi:hypothetical protein
MAMTKPMPAQPNDGGWSAERQKKAQMITQAIAIFSESIRNASGPPATPASAPQPQQTADIPQGSMFEARF